MKNYSLLILIFVIQIIAVSCGHYFKPDFSTPENTVKTYWKALGSGNFDLAVDCYWRGDRERTRMQFKAIEEDIGKKKFIELYRAEKKRVIIRTEIEGDRAIVTTNNEDDPYIYLIKENEKWKIYTPGIIFR